MLNRTLASAAASVSIGTSTATLGPWQVSGNVMSFSVSNAGSVALNTFAMQVKLHPSDVAFQTAVSGTNWINTDPMVLQVGAGGLGALASLASNTASFAIVRTCSAYQVQFTATTSSTTGTTLNLNPAFGF